MTYGGVSEREQEVVIRLDRHDGQAHISSAWPDWSRNPERLYGAPRKISKGQDGGVTCAFWTVPLGLVRLRRVQARRRLTEEQRERLAPLSSKLPVLPVRPTEILWGEDTTLRYGWGRYGLPNGVRPLATRRAPSEGVQIFKLGVLCIIGGREGGEWRFACPVIYDRPRRLGGRIPSGSRRPGPVPLWGDASRDPTYRDALSGMRLAGPR